MFNSVLIAAPDVDPISVAELKKHSRVTSNAEDDLCEQMIGAATEWCETYSNRVFITQTWDLCLDTGFPCNEISLPKSPLQSITHIKYVDDQGVLQTLDPSLYQVSTKGIVGRIAPAYEQIWPTVRPVLDAVQIRAVCGFSDDPEVVPKRIRQAIYLLAAHLYQNREGVVIGSGISADEVPFGIKSLLMGRKLFKV